MKLVYGDFWEYDADYHVITTNGIVRKDGACVMGAGVAKQAKDQFPLLPYALGRLIQESGNHVHYLGSFQNLVFSGHIWSFPVKQHWRDPADLDLIEQSANELAAFARENEAQTFVLVRPGIGNGRLDWAEVEPRIASLPDNVHVITYE